MFRSISWRIAVAYSVLVTLSMLALSIYLVSFVRSSYMDNLEATLSVEARLVANSVAGHLALEEDQEVDRLAKRLGQEMDGRITILSSGGEVIGDSSEDPSEVPGQLDRSEVTLALQGRPASGTYSLPGGGEVMEVAVPVVYDGLNPGAVAISVPLTGITNPLQHIISTVALVGAVTTAMIVLLSFYIARRTLAPVVEVTRMAQRMSEGDLEQRIRVQSGDEVGQLAQSFNQMAARLQAILGDATAERNRMLAIISNMTDGVIIADGTGKVNLLNPAAERMLGIPPRTGGGRSFIEVARDYELANLFRECLAAEDHCLPGSKIIDMGIPKRLIRAVVVRAGSGESLQVLVMLQDLTELRRLETARQELISNVSHELRTPLASLKAVVDTLEDGAIEDTGTARQFLARMSAELDRITQLVQGLLDLSRIESGKAELRRAPADLRDTITGAVEAMRLQADRAGIILEARLPHSLSLLMVDEERIRQVVENLLQNALRFTDAGGRVSVTVEERERDVAVSVADTGAGIDSEDLPRIFERFYKVDRSRAGGGTGLGLAIAKHLVQAHNGRIWAESAVGHGSTFIFTLPKMT